MTAGLAVGIAYQLEVQLRTELELPRIESRGRLAVVFTVTGPLAPGVDDLVEGVGRSFVESVEEIESFGDQIKADALAKSDPTREPRIDREIVVRDTHVSS